MTNHTYVIDD